MQTRSYENDIRVVHHGELREPRLHHPQPQHIKELSSIMIVNTAPLIAHFITYTKGKITNIMFITMLVMTVLILLYNIFIPETVLLQAVQGLSIHG